MDFKYFSKNGEIRPIEEAVVPLANIEYQYGFGVYENVRVENGSPRFIKDHVVRLEESARIIGLEHRYAASMIYHTIHELVEKTEQGTYNLKILLVGGQTPSLFIFPLNPHFPDKKLYRDGVHCITYEYERPFPHAKSLNMLESYLAYTKAREAGAHDALLVNSKGCITEGTRTNFFLMRDKALVSAPEAEILLGVTRKVLLDVAKGEGFTMVEEEIRFGDIDEADGAFLTSTSAKILPIRSIDEIELKPPPPSLRELMSAFDAFLASH